MPAALTKKDLQEALKGIATKEDVDNKVNESFANFRIKFNEDLESFATKDDIVSLEEKVGSLEEKISSLEENMVTKKDVEEAVHKSKVEVIEYIHHAVDTVVTAMDDINKEHLAKHHKISIATY